MEERQHATTRDGCADRAGDHLVRMQGARWDLCAIDGHRSHVRAHDRDHLEGDARVSDRSAPVDVELGLIIFLSQRQPRVVLVRRLPA